jgi:hypothetical protein
MSLKAFHDLLGYHDLQFEIYVLHIILHFHFHEYVYVCREKQTENNPHWRKFSVTLPCTQGRQMMEEWAGHEIPSEQ